jgi:dihydrofolate reductase
MGLLTFSMNVTLDGCCDHRAGAPDDDMLDWFTRLLEQSGGIIYGRTTYEMMEEAFQPLAKDANAPRAIGAWARAIDAKPKFVVSSTRSEFSWNNTSRLEGELSDAVTALKAKTSQGLLVGSHKLATALDRLGLIDEYRFVIHPVLAGHGPTLFQGQPTPRKLDLVTSERLPGGQIVTHYRTQKP